MGDALDISKPMRRIPIAHGLSSCRERRPLSHAYSKPGKKQGCEPAGKAGGNGPNANDHHTYRQCRFCTILARTPPAKDHRTQIGPGERAEDHSHLDIAKRKVRL